MYNKLNLFDQELTWNSLTCEIKLSWENLYQKKLSSLENNTTKHDSTWVRGLYFAFFVAELYIFSYV